VASRIRSRAQVAQLLLALTLALQSSSPIVMMPALADQAAVVALNNDGVQALNKGNFALAISKFEEALKQDATYQLARDNLAIAHNNYGLQLRNNPKEALKQFHKALYLNRTNATTLQNVEGIIRIMGKNPKSFQDRVELGDQSRLSGDFIGAIVEYSEALKLKDDAKLHIKLGDVYRVRGEDDKAVQEYLLAAKSGDSAEIELKLGQAYGAMHDIPNAITSYGKAISYKSDDPDVLDGLVAGWNEALKENPLAPENHIGLGQALQYRGDWGGAEAEYKAALRLSPGKRNSVAERLMAALPAAKAVADITKHINAGVDNQSRKDYDGAINEYKQALQADPNNAAVWVNVGTAYQAKGDFENAMKAYQQAQKIDPNNAGAMQGIKTAGASLQDKQVSDEWKAGGDLFKAGRYQEALQKYQSVLRVNPQDANTHYSLGAVYQALKQIDDAIAEYKTAISIDGKNQQYTKALNDALEVKAAPIIQEAVALHKAKNYEAAIAKYNQALALRPNNVELWYNVATAEYSRQNYNGAKAAYQKALELDPAGQVNDIYFTGLILENAGQGLDAKTQYQKYVSKAPTGQFVAEAKARIAALTNDISATQKIKSESELAQLKNADDAFQQAVKLQQSKQYDAAIDQYQKAISIQPKNQDYVFSLGTAFQAKGDIENAISQYRQAISMDGGKNKEFQKTLADAMELKVGPILDDAVAKQTKGDLAGAIEGYNKALAITPNVGRIWTNLGTALQQSDKWPEARAAYQKGYDLDNKNEVGDLYFMAVLDENANQGNKAFNEYSQYVQKAPTGPYATQARARIAVLQKNVADVQHLQTQGAIQTAKAAGEAYDAGVKAQQAGQFDDAIASYQKALQLNPKESAYLYAIGTAYQGKTDITNAIAYYKKALDMQPQNKDYKNALTAATVGAAAQPMDDAVKLQTAGDVPGAIKKYKESLAIDPKNARGWTNFGSAYQQAEDWANAKDCYQKALAIDPKGEADNLYFMGALDESMRNGSAALQDYLNYISRSPKGQYAGPAQARISALRANPAAIQGIATKAETQKNADAAAAYDAAVNAQTANKLDEAIESYKKAIGIAPNDASYFYGMGTAYQAKGDMDSAIEAYKKAVGFAPKEATYSKTLKDAQMFAGAAKAKPLVDEAIKLQTTDNNPAGAVVAYQKALAASDEGYTRMNMGTALQQLNKTIEAVNEYKRALQMDPKNCIDAHYYLGTAYEQLKKPIDAIKEYNEYLRLQPNGPNAGDARERVKILAATPGKK